MANPFSQLPREASLDTICGEAGKVFAARKANNPQTDFNTEIWYLAGDAMSAGFSALRGMTKEQVARAMGDSLARWIHSQTFSQLPREASLDTICSKAGKVFAARKANNPQTDFNTEIWYLAGDAMSAGFSALGGMTKEQVARAMGDSLSRWIHSQKIVFAFHNDQSVKERYIARVKAHAYAGKIDYETELGIPCHIASLQDCIFQNIPLGERGTFPLAFLEAIPVGADLSLVIPRFLVWLLSDPDGAKYLYDERGKQAIETVVALYQRLIDGSTVSKEEWLTAYRAACGGDAEVAVHAAAGCGGSVDVAGAVTAEVARAEAEAARADAATQAAHFDAQAAAHGIPSTYSGSTFSLIAADDARAYGAARAEAIRATGEARARTAAETYAALAARAAADAVHAEVSAQARAEFAPHTGPENDDDYYTYYRDYDASHPGPYNPYPRLDANVMRTRYCQRMRDKLLELLRTAPVPRAN